MLCPACENESENTQQCTNCGWQFVYFTQEPTEQEQNEYTILLQNYRTELYFNLAQQYYEKQQFEETIQCCMISCEHQLYENPLVYLALSHQALNNNEEALKYVNMVIQINSNNEVAVKLLAELDSNSNNQNEIIKLTSEILNKGRFETTEEYKSRIKNLGYVEIGYAYLGDYNADLEKLRFMGVMEDYIKKSFYTKENLKNANYGIDINPKEAKYLYSLDSVPLIAKIEIINDEFIFIDIKIEKHSFFEDFTKHIQSIKEVFDNKEKEKQEQKIRAEEKNKVRESIPTTWIDEVSGKEWKIKLSDTMYSFDKIPYNSSPWCIPSGYEMSILFGNLKNSESKICQDILEYLLEENECVWCSGVKHRTYEDYSNNMSEGRWTEYEYYLPSKGIGYSKYYDKKNYASSNRIRMYKNLPKLEKKSSKNNNSIWGKLWN